MKNTEQMTEPTPRQREIVGELARAAAALRMREKQFHAEFLPGDYYTWLNAKSVQVSERTLAGYEAVLPQIRAEVAKAKAVFTRAAMPVERPFFPTKFTRLVEGALRAAMKGGNRRIILVLGATGAGKTALRDHLALKYGGRIVRATESARTNFASVHLGIQQAFGSARNWATRVDLEAHTFNLLNGEATLLSPDNGGRSAAAPVILYDEGLRWGPHGCNIAVDLNDLTPAVQVIFALPEIVDRLSSKSFAESSQMMRRVLEVVELGDITAADVEPFLAGLGLNGATERTAKLIAEKATEYGRFDFVERVRDAIRLGGVHEFNAIVDIVDDEREAIRVQRQTEKLRMAQEASRRKSRVRFADKNPVQVAS